MAISKTGLVAGSPQSLNDLVDKINALPATGFSKIAKIDPVVTMDSSIFNDFLVKVKAAGIMSST